MRPINNGYAHFKAALAKTFRGRIDFPYLSTRFTPTPFVTRKVVNKRISYFYLRIDLHCNLSSADLYSFALLLLEEQNGTNTLKQIYSFNLSTGVDADALKQLNKTKETSC